MTRRCVDALDWGATQLHEIADRPRAEARLLLAHVLGISSEAVFAEPNRLLSADTLTAFETFIQRRTAHEPIAKIIGQKAFWKSSFRVTRDTLDPRPDSETLIEGALAYFKDRTSPSRVLDLGTGSGCLLISLLLEFPEATGVGVDLSPAALAVAEQNVADHGLEGRVELVLSDWRTWRTHVAAKPWATAPFDLIVANPPYIPTEDRATLSPDVQNFDPPSALFAGKDGLSCYPELLNEIRESLSPTGYAFVENGAGQAPAIAKLCDGLVVHAHLQDLGGHVRCLVFGQKRTVV
jgi:release factor glutamine methyltransferase